MGIQCAFIMLSRADTGKVLLTIQVVLTIQCAFIMLSRADTGKVLLTIQVVLTTGCMSIAPVSMILALHLHAH